MINHVLSENDNFLSIVFCFDNLLRQLPTKSVHPSWDTSWDTLWRSYPQIGKARRPHGVICVSLKVELFASVVVQVLFNSALFNNYFQDAICTLRLLRTSAAAYRIIGGTSGTVGPWHKWALKEKSQSISTLHHHVHLALNSIKLLPYFGSAIIKASTTFAESDITTICWETGKCRISLKHFFLNMFQAIEW